MSEFNRRPILDRDKAIFRKAVKLYFFINHVKHDTIHPDLSDRFSHCANIIYSMLRGYMEAGTFQIEYLDFLNEEITNWVNMDDKYFKNFQIKPVEIDEIELNGRIPMKFQDAETGEQLRLMFFPNEDYCDYSVLNLN